MKINLNAVAPWILGSRGTPSKFVLYALKDMYAKFGAFTRFVPIFVHFDANGLDYYVLIINCGSSAITDMARKQASDQLLAVKLGKWIAGKGGRGMKAYPAMLLE